jgi:hypothetical protein
MPTSVKICQNGRVTIDNNQAMPKTKMTHEWKIEKNANEYKLCVYGKTSGKNNMVNLYEFPPPIDKILFYGDVFVIGYKKRESTFELVDLSVDLWEMFYQHTFQFESLKHSELSDEHEIDELKLVPLHLKTKHGYLKDGFVVDDDDDDDDL